MQKDQKDILLEEIMAKTQRLFPEKKTETIVNMEDHQFFEKYRNNPFFKIKVDLMVRRQ